MSFVNSPPPTPSATVDNCMVPTWTRKTGKPGKIRKLFPVSEKSGNFEHTGKVGEFYPKYWENEEILTSFYFHFFFDFLIEVYLLNSLNKTLNKILENKKKKLEKSGKFVSLKMWEP